MKVLSAREANQNFSALLSRVENGEEIVVTKRGRPVAIVTPYKAAAVTPEREAAIARMVKSMKEGLPWGANLRRFSRDEMHER